ncbi:MAG: hypothetical protein FWF57_01470 [Defluviitaleaceae bacterium]|nr:hypothetical protein [Defluviitaleaceae bacterium]
MKNKKIYVKRRRTKKEIEDLKELEALFDEVQKDAIEFFEENGFHKEKSVAIIRNGIFYNDRKTIEMGLAQLKEQGEHELYELMLLEVIEFDIVRKIRGID